MACAAAPHLALAITIDTVLVGDAGNAGELSGGVFGLEATVGGVAYDYRIGTTEVTNAQYVAFLNAVAATDTYGLYNADMGSYTQGGIIQSGSSGSYSYSVKADAGSYTYAEKPVNFVSWYDTMRFANWLHNGQPTGLQNATTTENGAYRFSGATSVGARKVGAIWFLPSEDEWYKAAYYNGSTYYDYPTGTDTTPDNNLPSLDSGNSANFRDGGVYTTTGGYLYPLTDVGAYTLSASPYGTFDQGGNVGEWTETLVSSPGGGLFPGARGGGFYGNSNYLSSLYRQYSISTNDGTDLGFRVAAIATVPEPSTIALAAYGLASLIACACRRRKI